MGARGSATGPDVPSGGGGVKAEQVGDAGRRVDGGTPTDSACIRSSTRPTHPPLPAVLLCQHSARRPLYGCTYVQ